LKDFRSLPFPVRPIIILSSSSLNSLAIRLTAFVQSASVLLRDYLPANRERIRGSRHARILQSIGGEQKLMSLLASAQARLRKS